MARRLPARYVVTRYRRDTRVAARHFRSGFGAFDTHHPTAPVQLFATRQEARQEADRLNRLATPDR